MKQITGKYFSKVLISNGWELKKTNGRHHIFTRQGKIERISVVSTIDEITSNVDVILLAVKPNMVKNICELLAVKEGNWTTLVSIAAGIPIKKIVNYLPDKQVIRVMPNTPLLVNAGAGALCSNLKTERFNFILKLFRNTGEFFELDESLFDVVTGLSGSGPAYVFVAIEALADGGVKMGLPRDIAYKLAAQTVFGSAKLMISSNKHPGQLKDMVTSPKGTTIEAISVLENGKFRANLINAVEAATKRSKELGK